jgi:hypothetical protein
MKKKWVAAKEKKGIRNGWGRNGCIGNKERRNGREKFPMCRK